jgi:HAMP domain-containing protein
MSIKLKVVLGVLASLALSALGNVRLAAWLRREDVEAAARQALRTAAETYADLEQADVEKLSAVLEGVSADPSLAEAFLRRDRPRLLELAGPVFAALRERHGVTHWYFHDPEPARSCFLRVHAPALHGDVIQRPTFEAAVARQATASGTELGRTAFALRVVRPWTRGGKLIGYLELGEEIDHFLRRMRRQTGDEFAMLVLKERLDEKAWAATRGAARNTWGDRPDVVVVNSTADERLLGWQGRVQDLPEGGRVLGLDRGGDRALVRGAVPLADASGARVGALLVLHDVTALDRGLEDHYRGVSVMVLAIALGASVLLVLLLERLVFRRLERLMARMEDLGARVAGGDYDVAPDGPPPSGDEIGRLEEFFARFLRVVGGALSDLQRRQGRDG